MLLLYDVYTKYRTDDRISAAKKENHGWYPKNSIQFVEESYLLSHLNVNVGNAIAIAMEAYEHRLIPGFKFKPEQIYADNCEVYVLYTIMVAKIIRNIMKTSYADGVVYVPFQVDLIIIPRKIVPESNEMYDIDTDSEPEAEEIKIDTIEDDNAGYQHLFKTFEIVFKRKYKDENLTYIKTKTSHANIDEYRHLSKDIVDYFGGKNGQRVSIIIDRRTTPDTMYVYALPAKRSHFPLDCSLTMLVHLSSQYVIPIWDEIIEKADKFPFTGGGYGPGKMFQVSYQVLGDDRTRLQWNFAVLHFFLFCCFMIFC